MSREADESIAVEWRRIESWIARNASSWIGARGGEPLFRGPASEQAIEQLERHLGIVLPDAIRTLLRTCDGCRRGSYPLPSRATRPTHWRTLSAHEIASERERLSRTAGLGPAGGAIRSVGPVRSVWWDEGWIPLCDCGMGDIICADTSPAAGGTVGQLVLYEHDFGERKVLYAGLADWLRECANDLESGAYIHEPGVGLRATEGGR